MKLLGMKRIREDQTHNAGSKEKLQEVGPTKFCTMFSKISLTECMQSMHRSLGDFRYSVAPIHDPAKAQSTHLLDYISRNNGIQRKFNESQNKNVICPVKLTV